MHKPIAYYFPFNQSIDLTLNPVIIDKVGPSQQEHSQDNQCHLVIIGNKPPTHLSHKIILINDIALWLVSLPGNNYSSLTLVNRLVIVEYQWSWCSSLCCVTKPPTIYKNRRGCALCCTILSYQGLYYLERFKSFLNFSIHL